LINAGSGDAGIRPPGISTHLFEAAISIVSPVAFDAADFYASAWNADD
jgi:hypothetical protein